MTGPMRRKPVWSGALTPLLRRAIPPAHRPEALAAIRAIHTAIFGSITGALALTLWDGLRGRPGRRTAITGGIVLVETGLYLSNGQVCPLTPLAQELGDDSSGSVVDLYLPPAVARRIPVVAGAALALAVVLNLAAMARSVRGGRHVAR